MTIGILNQAQTGIQSGLLSRDNAAHHIASQVTRSPNNEATFNEKPNIEVSTHTKQQSMSDSLVALNKAQVDITANAKLIQQGDEILGSIIDVFA